MATGSVQITAGSGTPIRVVTNAAVDSGADQQIVTLADSAGNLLGTVAAPLPVQQADQSATISLAAASATSGSLTAMTGASSCVIQLTGTFVATVQLQVTADNTNWINITGSNTIINAATGAYIAGGNLTSTGAYQLDIGGFLGVRVIATAYTSGTVTGVVRVTNASAAVSVEGVPTVLLTAGTNAIGNITSIVNAVGLAAGTNQIGSILNINGASTSTYSVVTAATTNAAVIKTAAGNLFELTVSNPTATACFVKLYQKASAPTVGTDVPVATYRVAATGTAGDTITIGYGTNGKRFQTGIAIAVTGAVTAADTTAAVALVQIHASYL